MRVIGFVLCLVLLASLGGAQVYTDTFSGSSLLGWTQHGSTWSLTALKQLQANPARTYQYLTWDSSNSLNAVMEIKVFYNTASASKLQFGGGTLRFVSASDCVMNKTQDNNSSGDFDRFFVYDQPGGSAYQDPKVHTAAVVRLIALGTDLIGRIDIDLDGKWDNVVTKTTTKTPTAGKVGISGYGGALFDDFKYFDAVVRLHAKSPPPTPGATIGLQLGGDAGKAYQCAASFGNNMGVTLIDGRRIPLNVDPLMELSIKNPILFGSFVGKLDASGLASATVQIPNAPTLKGFHFYVGMITIDPKSRTGIGNIANDFRIDIQ